MHFRKGDSMKVKILQGGGYVDRYGKKYDQHSVADMPDWLALKLARMRIVEIVAGKVPKPSVVTTVALAPPETTMRPSGHPRKPDKD